MEFAGYRNLMIAAILLGLVVLFLIVTIKRSRSANQSHDVTSARLRRIYVCVLLMAGALIVFMGLWALAESSEKSEGYGMLMGMFMMPLYWIAFPVAAYNSLLLWRLRPIRILWALGLLVGIALWVLSDRVSEQLLLVLFVAYLLTTIAIAIRGLVAIRQTVSKGGQDRWTSAV